MSQEKSLIVIGAGPMGLATAYFAAKNGYTVDVVEADDRVGGMAAHFDFDGLSIERFYHFCCLSDENTLSLMEEIGMQNQMNWVATTMGFQVGRELFDWGNPWALLKFPKMNLLEKLRYGLLAFTSTKRTDWSKLDKISAPDWFRAWVGERVYNLMWRPLLEYKFYEFTNSISAAWMWQRIYRLGNSRKSLFEERLGYIEGGSEALMERLATRIRELGGTIHLSARAEQFLIDERQVKGVEVSGQEALYASNVISTAPTPIAARLLAEVDPSLSETYNFIDNIGCICVLLKLKRSLTPHFWVNITETEFEIPGIVEFSNLRPLSDTVVYVPFYMPNTMEKFQSSDADFIDESVRCLKLINSDLKDADILASHVARLKHAQPIYDVEFQKTLPQIQTPIRGLQIADTSFYYPEDRGVSESIRIARSMVDNLDRAT